MRFREKRRLRREIRRDLFDLRRNHKDMDYDDFEELAEETLKDEWAGVDPEVWDFILELIKELLPLILDIFLD